MFSDNTTSASVIKLRGEPKSIQVDNGSELYSRAMDRWAYRHGVQLEFIRPSRPMDNGHIGIMRGVRFAIRPLRALVLFHLFLVP